MQVYEIRGGFGLQNVSIADRPEPTPGPGEVLIRMRAVSLNYRDLGVIEGFYDPTMRMPLIPASDGVGEVIALGARTSRFQVGDRVSGIFTQGWCGCRRI